MNLYSLPVSIEHNGDESPTDYSISNMYLELEIYGTENWALVFVFPLLCYLD